jgi:hypothetical protein
VEEIRIRGVPTHNFSGDKTLIARVVVNPTAIRSLAFDQVDEAKNM